MKNIEIIEPKASIKLSSKEFDAFKLLIKQTKQDND